MFKRCLYFAAACSLLLPSALHAQAKPVATGTGIIQVGGAFTSANPDYGQKRISGGTIYGTFDFLLHSSVGIEADAHILSLSTPQDLSEKSYEIGPRYVYRHGIFEPYAKVLIGIASQNFLADTYNPPTSKSYLNYAAAVGLDIRCPHHINVRAIDYELQTWPTYSPNNLSPKLISVGVAYRLR